MLESFVRRYVRLILEIDKVSQTDRMQRAALFSEARFWDAFGKERFKSIEKALDGGLNRSIMVESADLVARRGGVSRYAVDFVQTDERKGALIETKKLRAYLAVTAAPQTVQKSEQYENPAGFRVIDLPGRKGQLMTRSRRRGFPLRIVTLALASLASRPCRGSRRPPRNAVRRAGRQVPRRLPQGPGPASRAARTTQAVPQCVARRRKWKPPRAVPARIKRPNSSC